MASHGISESVDGDLAAELRRIRLISRVAAGVWMLAAAVLTLTISDRILVGYLADASDAAARDAASVAATVERMFHELAILPRVLSSNRDLRDIVMRYNAAGERFAQMPEGARGALLKQDAEVSHAGERLTAIRNDLGYDLIYVLDARGIRVVSSDWDAPVTVLGVTLDDREYFKAAMEDRAGQLFAVAPTTRNPVLAFSAPIQGDDGPIGAVVTRQDSDAIGEMLAGTGHLTFIVDAAGMIVASSRTEFRLHHMGALASARPDAALLRTLYAQDSLREINVTRPRRIMHDDEWMFEGHPYLLKRNPLTVAGYSLLTMSAIERFEAARPLHYAIGVLVALFGIVIALLGDRRAENLARRRHELRTTAAFNEKLKALNDEKDRYLGIAAHDLRNPLSSMRGLSELMLETRLEPDQQREFLETIHRTSDEMLGLVNDLLDTSVIESGKLDLKRTDNDVSRLLRQRIRHLEPQAKNKQIALVIDAAAGQRASIDAARFAQVIDNLISNAVKFSPLATSVDVSLRFGGASFAFEVQDHGPGISDEDKKLLFRSFQKLSARPTAGEKSTGLGLAIVKKIVDAHGGRIEVGDTEGGGTRFTVTMPSGAAPLPKATAVVSGVAGV